jgi:hypothetical protein
MALRKAATAINILTLSKQLRQIALPELYGLQIMVEATGFSAAWYLFAKLHGVMSHKIDVLIQLREPQIPQKDFYFRNYERLILYPYWNITHARNMKCTYMYSSHISVGVCPSCPLCFSQTARRGETAPEKY